MRQQLKQVLGSEDHDEVMTDVVLRFWTRAKPLAATIDRRPIAPVVDLAAWSRSHPSVR